MPEGEQQLNIRRMKNNNNIRLSGIVADSYMIMRGDKPNVEWLNPDREWTKSIFDAVRFEIDDKDNAEAWLRREIEASPVLGG